MHLTWSEATTLSASVFLLFKGADLVPQLSQTSWPQGTVSAHLENPTTHLHGASLALDTQVPTLFCLEGFKYSAAKRDKV